METVDDFATLEISIKPPRGRPSLAYGRTQINGNFNPGDGLAMSRIAQKERAYIYEFARFLRTHVPGFEESDMLWLHSPVHGVVRASKASIS